MKITQSLIDLRRAFDAHELSEFEIVVPSKIDRMRLTMAIEEEIGPIYRTKHDGPDIIKFYGVPITVRGEA